MHAFNGNFGFGGVGESGIGRYHGKVGFEAFSNMKSVLSRPPVNDYPYPFDEDVQKMQTEYKDYLNRLTTRHLTNATVCCGCTTLCVTGATTAACLL